MRLGRTADAARVEDATHVVTGGAGSGSVRAVAYAAYVAVMIGATYGFTVAQAVLRTSDPAALRTQLTSPIGIGAAVGLAVLGLVLVHRASVVRGAVVPPTPWTDQVVSSPNDRAVTLRRWWLVSLSGCIIGGALVGAILGGAAWYAGIGGVASMVGGIVVGALYGTTIAVLWLAGQAHGSSRALWSAPTTALRSMRIDDLRSQAARSAVLGGSILSGDLRAARFELFAPSTRARTTRLRHRGPLLTVMARDLLGMRRNPAGAAVAVVTSAAALALIGWTVGSSAAPIALPILLGLLAHLGASGLGEGMRQQADNLGAPVLHGLGRRGETAAHAFVLGGGVLLVGVVTLVPVAVASGAGPARAALSLVLVTLGLVGSVGTAAFRGPMPRSPFAGSGIPTALFGWYAFPSVLAAGAIGAVVRGFAGGDTIGLTAWIGIVWVITLLVMADRFGARLERAHREG